MRSIISSVISSTLLLSAVVLTPVVSAAYGGGYGGGATEEYVEEKEEEPYTCYKGDNIKGCGYQYNWMSERGYVFAPSRYAGTGELGYTRHNKINSIGECATICKAEYAEAGEYGQDGNPRMCYCVHKAECREPDKRLREKGGTVFSMYPKPAVCPKSFCDKDYFFFDKKMYCQSRGFVVDEGYTPEYPDYGVSDGYDPKPAPYSQPVGYPKPAPVYEEKPAYGDGGYNPSPYSQPVGNPKILPVFEEKPVYGDGGYDPKPAPYSQPVGNPKILPVFEEKPVYGGEPVYEEKPVYGGEPVYEEEEENKYDDKPEYAGEPVYNKEEPVYNNEEPVYGERPPVYDGPPPSYVSPVEAPPGLYYPPSLSPPVMYEDDLGRGNPKHLKNPKKGKGGFLNTSKGKESKEAIEERLSGAECPVGDDPEHPNHCPIDPEYLVYAKCFNEHYEEDDVYIPSAAELYADYKGLFDYGFSLKDDDVSSSPLNNKVTTHRWPGMMLRMCFHDNSVDPYYKHFQDYIDEHLEEINFDDYGDDKYGNNSGKGSKYKSGSSSGKYKSGSSSGKYKSGSSSGKYNSGSSSGKYNSGSSSGKYNSGSSSGKYKSGSSSGKYKSGSSSSKYNSGSSSGKYNSGSSSGKYKSGKSSGGKYKSGTSSGGKYKSGKKACTSGKGSGKSGKGGSNNDCYDMEIEREWTGPRRFMDTSGADASMLMCPAERLHPNNNYDKTASRVLNTFLRKDMPHLEGYSMMEKYGMSYADLLHNGCQAATVYLTTFERTNINVAEHIPAPYDHLENGLKKLYPGVFRFGRRDACYKDPEADEYSTDFYTGHHKKFALCGPTELLPGLGMNAKGYDDWFMSRGMGSCNWQALMWTHTTMANMASECPIKSLPSSRASYADVAVFEKYDNKASLYFKPGDDIDYWRHFMARGVHIPTKYVPENEEESGCEWIVDGYTVRWPMTRTDCVLSLDAIKRQQLHRLSMIAGQVAEWTKTEATNALFCSLQMLGGSGKNKDIDCAPYINGEFVPCSRAEMGGDADEHMWGSFVPNGFFQAFEKYPDEEAYNYDYTSDSYQQGDRTGRDYIEAGSLKASASSSASTKFTSTNKLMASALAGVLALCGGMFVTM
jgi:hypothetical protein